MIILEFPTPLEAYVPVADTRLTPEIYQELYKMADEAIRKTADRHFTPKQIVRFQWQAIEIMDAPQSVIDTWPAGMYPATLLKFARMTARIWLRVKDKAELRALEEQVSAYYKRGEVEAA